MQQRDGLAWMRCSSFRLLEAGRARRPSGNADASTRSAPASLPRSLAFDEARFGTPCRFKQCDWCVAKCAFNDVTLPGTAYARRGQIGKMGELSTSAPCRLRTGGGRTGDTDGWRHRHARTATRDAQVGCSKRSSLNGGALSAEPRSLQHRCVPTRALEAWSWRKTSATNDWADVWGS